MEDCTYVCSKECKNKIIGIQTYKFWLFQYLERLIETLHRNNTISFVYRIYILERIRSTYEKILYYSKKQSFLISLEV